MFGVLLLLEWLAGIFVALWISPCTWSGTNSYVHTHIWVATLLNGLILSVPLGLVILQPGKILTRQAVAVAQNAHLGHADPPDGRADRDALPRFWFIGVPGPVSGLARAPNGLGVSWPRATSWADCICPRQPMACLIPDRWRWLEHASWVVFEDAVLIPACIQGRREIWEIAVRTAELEATNAAIERTVIERTAKLRASEAELHRAKDAAEAASRPRASFSPT